jgi:hypothetical protein
MKEKNIIFPESDINIIMPMPNKMKLIPKNSIGTPIVTGGRVIPRNRGSISILSSAICHSEPEMLSTMAGAPNTKIIPPITDRANCIEIRPNIHANPKKTTAIMAMILAQVEVRRLCRAFRKFVPEENNADDCANASSGYRRRMPVSAKVMI